MGAKRLIVVGAGPMGLCAALGAQERGFDVSVLERGQVGESLRRWGPTRFFTPLRMNLSPLCRGVLNGRLPAPETVLTGPEMADRVLVPLAGSTALRGRVRTGHRVVSIGRSGLTRTELAGHPIRAERPFRIVTERGGVEERWEADIVLDASGGFAVPNPAGAGGIPALGERALGDRLIRDLGELDGRLGSLAGKSILVIGHGHSAATAILLLSGLARRDPGMCVTWAVRSANRRPCEEVAEDPLPERRRVVSQANDLAGSPAAFLSVRRRTAIEEIHPENGRLRVRFAREQPEVFDEIVSLTGYRPDYGFLSELALELSAASEGPAALSRALSGVTDCLSIPRVRPEDLASGEPNFFFVGAKSYGRRRTFLLQTGLSHLDAILAVLAGTPA
ncbi:MAG: NAD(P)-binding domain-containing protein [Thermoanaerobaculia bacterium]